MLTGVVPVLVNVAVCGGDVPPTASKRKLIPGYAGLMDTRLPIPWSCTTSEPALSSSLIVRMPLLDPVTVGVKLTEILQLAFGASVDGQLLAWPKSPLIEKLDIVTGTLRTLTIRNW